VVCVCCLYTGIILNCSRHQLSPLLPSLTKTHLCPTKTFWVSPQWDIVLEQTNSQYFPTMQKYTDHQQNIIILSQYFIHFSFYRAMPCIRGTSHGPVSVRPSVSVTNRSSTKTAIRRITQTTPHDSPGTLVFGCQRSPRNSTGITPCGGTKYRWGGSKSATFDK